MRRGLFNRKWIADGYNLIGISLGSDYCAEHECGISEMRDAFGVRKSVIEKKFLGLTTVEKTLYGIEIRTIHKNKVSFFEKDGVCLLGYTSGNPEYLKSLIKADTSQQLDNTEEGFMGLWNSRSFAILSKDNSKMKTMRDAFDRLDIALFVGKSEVFDNGSGLNICIVSKMPKQVTEHMRDSDINAYTLRKAVDKMKIEERLKEAGCTYYALSPKWKNNIANGEIIFWLNPMEQHKYNAGWFNEAQLDEWTKGAGPIIKKEKI